MVAQRERVQLVGRVLLHADLHLVTGLHIGVGEDIGIGKATEVLRDPLTSEPYIPGSSLRGKMRSLAERVRGIDRDSDNVQDIDGSKIHSCTTASEYSACNVCPVFGVPASEEYAFSLPTRLIVRDARLNEASVASLKRVRTALPFAEVKTEVAIDRITSAAVPRDIARIPAGAVFGDVQFSFAMYEEQDLDRLKVMAHAMAYLEDDYLGGHGARGYGRVRFENIRLTAKNYRIGVEPIEGPQSFENTSDLNTKWDDIVWDWLVDALPWAGA